MPKIGYGIAVALATLVGNHAAEAQTPIPPSPKDFALAASQIDQYEILAARVAEVQSQNPSVRMFADEISEDHTALSQQFRAAVLASGSEPPEPGMSSDQASFLSSLQSVRGPEFDKTYARQQELVHAQADALVESFAMTCSDSTLQKAAQSALPVIRDHLKKAEQLMRELSGP